MQGQLIVNTRHILLNTVIIALFSGQLYPSDSEFILPDIEEYMLDNGMRLLISTNYDDPVIYISAYFNIGRLDDPLDNPGIASIVYDELLNGTNTYPSKKELKDKMHKLI